MLNFLCVKSPQQQHFFSVLFICIHPLPPAYFLKNFFKTKWFFSEISLVVIACIFCWPWCFLLQLYYFFLRIKMDFSLYYYTLKKELCLLFLKRVNMMPSFTILLYLAPYVLKNKWIYRYLNFALFFFFPIPIVFLIPYRNQICNHLNFFRSLDNFWNKNELYKEILKKVILVTT